MKLITTFIFLQFAIYQLLGQDVRNSTLTIIDSMFKQNNEELCFVFINWDSIIEEIKYDGFYGLIKKNKINDSIYQKNPLVRYYNNDNWSKDSILLALKKTELKSNENRGYKAIFVQKPLDGWMNTNSMFFSSYELSFIIEIFEKDINGKITLVRELVKIRNEKGKLFLISENKIWSHFDE